MVAFHLIKPNQCLLWFLLPLPTLYMTWGQRQVNTVASCLTTCHYWDVCILGNQYSSICFLTRAWDSGSNLAFPLFYFWSVPICIYSPSIHIFSAFGKSYAFLAILCFFCHSPNWCPYVFFGCWPCFREKL